LWGVLSVGIFAAGNPDSAAWNGIDHAVTGLLYGGGFGQLTAQLFEAGSVFVVAFGLSYVFFRVLDGFGILRSEPQAEIIGLDIPEMGTRGYWEGAHPDLKTVI
jgi:Amt family ammonium transporter